MVRLFGPPTAHWIVVPAPLIVNVELPPVNVPPVTETLPLVVAASAPRLSVPPLIGAAVIIAIGLVCARYLRHRRRDVGVAEGV